MTYINDDKDYTISLEEREDQQDKQHDSTNNINKKK